MGQRGRRLRAVLDGQFLVFVLLFAAAVVGGGVLTHDAYVDPGVSVEQQPVPSPTFVGEFTHRATVRRATPAFDAGETLVERQAYITRIAPRLNGTFEYEYQPPESVSGSTAGTVVADGTLELRLRSVGERADGPPIEYWSVTRELDRVESVELAPGERLRFEFSRNVSAVFDEAARIDEQVGGTPGEKRVSVVAVVESTGEVAGRSVTHTREYRLGLTDDGSVYRVSDPGRVTDEPAANATRAVTVPNTPGPLRRGGGPLLLVVGLAGLAGLGLGRYRGDIALTDAERAYLTYERTREEFDDWITTVRASPGTLDGEHVDVERLEGLVDLAIDSDRRVLVDDTAGTYYCRVDGLVYRYDPPPEPEAGPLAGLVAGGRTVPDGRPDEWPERSDGTVDTSTDGATDEGDHDST